MWAGDQAGLPSVHDSEEKRKLSRLVIYNTLLLQLVNGLVELLLVLLH